MPVTTDWTDIFATGEIRGTDGIGVPFTVNVDTTPKLAPAAVVPFLAAHGFSPGSNLAIGDSTGEVYLVDGEGEAEEFRGLVHLVLADGTRLIRIPLDLACGESVWYTLPPVEQWLSDALDAVLPSTLVTNAPPLDFSVAPRHTSLDETENGG